MQRPKACLDCAAKDKALTPEDLARLNRLSYRKRYAAGQLIAGLSNNPGRGDQAHQVFARAAVITRVARRGITICGPRELEPLRLSVCNS